MKLKELAELLNAQPHFQNKNDGELIIDKIAAIQDAHQGEITFISNPEYTKYLATTKASAVILAQPQPDCKIPQLVHKNPYLCYAKTAGYFYRPAEQHHGRSELAFVAKDAELGQRVTIYPFVYVSSKAVIGNDVILYPGCYVGENVTIGDKCVIHAHCTILNNSVLGSRVVLHSGTVIGADGFGFATSEHEIIKIPQMGSVEIEDDVEMGALCTVDRAALGKTIIKRGTKFDDRVHIGHNVEVGENCMFAAFTGIAGSTKIGDWVLIGGHSGVAGHLNVQDRTRLGAMTGLIADSEQGQTYLGFPAIPSREWHRQRVYLKRLADYDRKIKHLEQQVQQLINMANASQSKC